MISPNKALPIILALTLPACSTVDKFSTPIQSAYQDRGVVVNNQGQLEPLNINDCKFDSYYWKPSGEFDEDTLNNNFNSRLTGMILDLIEKDGDVYISSQPNIKDGASQQVLSQLPTLNSNLNNSVNADTSFILNLKNLDNINSFQQLTDIIIDSNNNKNIKIIANQQQQHALKTMLPNDIMIAPTLNKGIKQTNFELLALCQSLNNDIIQNSYLDNDEIEQLIAQKQIATEDLIRALPYDANFSNLAYQKKLWEQGQYQTFNGKNNKLTVETSTYAPLIINSSAVNREQGRAQGPGSILINMK